MLAASASAQEQGPPSGGGNELTEEERYARAEDFVSKAQAYIGGKERIDALRSLRMKGVLTPGGGEPGTIETVYLRPDYQQSVSVLAGLKETTTLNGTEAWRRVESATTQGPSQLSLYSADDARQLQASVADMLSFHGTPPTFKGSILYLGTRELEGAPVLAMRYEHSDDYWFIKYFDPETARLLHMVNAQGIIYSYEGEIEASGLKFPKSVVVRFITQFGEQQLSISYSQIVVNEEVDPEMFRVPLK